MGRFATGITIVSTQVNGRSYGFTANSFASVSLEPPMILCCIQNESSFIDHLKTTKKFAISILNDEQIDTSNLFANPCIDSIERFSIQEHEMSPLGNPIIFNSLTWIDCQLSELYKVGDHHVCIGTVHHMSTKAINGNPLLYYSGGYRKLHRV